MYGPRDLPLPEYTGVDRKIFAVGIAVRHLSGSQIGGHLEVSHV
jgi:hypothetical protein